MSEQQAGSGGDNTPPDYVEPISYFPVIRYSQLPEKPHREFLNLALFLLILLSFGLLHYFFCNVGTLIGLVAYALVGIFAMQYAQKGSREVKEPTLPLMPSDRARISITGHPSEIRRLSVPQNVAFEPIIFQRGYAGAPVWLMGILGCCVGAAIIAIISVFVPVAGEIMIVSGFAPFLGIPILWGVSLLAPTYYRIIPGQLDIMQFSPLMKRVRLFSRWNLRDARIHVRFDKEKVEICSHGRDESVHLRGISEPYKFIEALLMGALSTHPAGPVPIDRLLG
ncbi:MAG: hypothetical protein HZA51_13655 [Planctomycetes bacterium]|nr:hypothetical protein [Planctomycetota bacterium]